MAAAFRREVATQLKLGLPQSLSALARRALDIITLTFVGRVGPDAMAAAALATSTNNVIAFSVFVGLSTATMTLTSQAKGAGDDAQAGYWLHRALLIHAAAAVPMTILVLLLAPILTLLHQDPVLASAAGSYAANLIPSMWAFGATFVLMPWLQVYSVVRMPLAVSLLIVPLHVGLLQLLINTLGFGVLGAARASSISATLNVVTVALIAGSCLRDHLPFRAVARASCARSCDFLRLGLPGVLMLGEWWASEIGILLTGLLEEPATNLAAISIYQTVNALCFMWPLGASYAGATRVGRSLGEGGAAGAAGARRAAMACFAICVVDATLFALVLLVIKERVAHIFTTDAAIVAKLGELLPNLLLYIIADAGQISMSGVLQGSGRQRIAGPVVLLSYYLVGLPTGAALGFAGGMGARGIVTGLLVGKVCHFLLYMALVVRTDWQLEVSAAARRVANEAAAVGRRDGAGGEMIEATAAAAAVGIEADSAAVHGGVVEKVTAVQRQPSRASCYARFNEEDDGDDDQRIVSPSMGAETPPAPGTRTTSMAAAAELDAVGGPRD